MDDRALDELRLDEHSEFGPPAMRLLDDGTYQSVDEPLLPGLYISGSVDEWVDDGDEDGPSAFHVSVRTSRVRLPRSAVSRAVMHRVHYRHQARGVRTARARRGSARRVARGGRDGPARSADEGPDPDHLTGEVPA